VALAEQFAREHPNGDVKVEFSDTSWRPTGRDFNVAVPYANKKGIYVFCGEIGHSPASESDADV